MDSRQDSTSNSLGAKAAAKNTLWVLLELAGILGLILLRIPFGPIIILLVCLIKILFHRLGWKEIGLARPENIWRILGGGLILAVLYQLLSILVLIPILNHFTHTRIDLSQITALKDNWVNLPIAVLVSWTWAAFGEEIVYRGYIYLLINKLFSPNRAGMLLGVTICAGLFAIGHGYQGLSGIFENMIFGLALGIVYILSKNNLWWPIIIHGFVDTIGFGLLFAGWYS